MPQPDMPNMKALSYGDKWRVGRCLARGDGPSNPRLAPAAVELAESYRRYSPRRATAMRAFAVFVAVVSGGAAVLFAIDGDPVLAAANGVISLTHVAQLALNPMFRPANVARCLEASRRMAGMGAEWTQAVASDLPDRE